MDTKLQVIMTVSSVLFLIYVILMVRNKKIELNYTLIWLLTAVSFIVISLFPALLKIISRLLNIIEPVNTLFLSIIFFMLLIIFSLTVAVSKSAGMIKALTQEIGILKLIVMQSRDGRGDVS